MYPPLQLTSLSIYSVAYSDQSIVILTFACSTQLVITLYHLSIRSNIFSITIFIKIRNFLSPTTIILIDQLNFLNNVLTFAFEL